MYFGRIFDKNGLISDFFSCWIQSRRISDSTLQKRILDFILRTNFRKVRTDFGFHFLSDTIRTKTDELNSTLQKRILDFVLRTNFRQERTDFGFHFLLDTIRTNFGFHFTKKNCRFYTSDEFQKSTD